MFEDILGEVKVEYEQLAKEGTTTGGIDSEIIQIELQIKQVITDLYNCRGVYEYTQKQLNENLASNIVGDMNYNRDPLRILYESLKLALQMNKEYDHPFFKTGLISALNDPKTIIFVASGNRSAIVHINLNETAGSTADYAKAVKAVREMMLKGRKLVTSGEVASVFWAEKFYKPAREGGKVTRRRFNRKTREYEKRDVTAEQIEKYWNTMKARLAAAGKPAPYWEIIDKGMAAMTGGGTPYPVPTPTNFVGRAEQQIKDTFLEKMNYRFNMYSEDLRSIAIQIDFLQTKLQELNDLLDELKSKKTPELMFYIKVIKYGRPYSKKKVNQVLMALRSRQFGEISITAENRVEITAPGEKRLRIMLTGISRTFDLGL